MKKVVVITGANGMLAKSLGKQLEEEFSVRFLTRNVTQDNEYFWDLKKNYIDPKALIAANIIIHLAGSSIANKRWTEKRKQSIISSRVDSAQLILEELKKKNQTIETFISASAIGYYGAITTNTILNEESPKGTDFLSDVCSQWENVANLFKTDSIANRVSIVRIGIIFDKNEGALKKIMQSVTYGFGSVFGNGNQFMPWIHMEDLCGIFKFIIENKQISGTFNAVSPDHITNKALTKEIGNVIGRKLILLKVPSLLLQGLLGKMSVLLLEGSKVSSAKIIEAGYNFKYKKLNQALNNLLK